MKRKVIVACGGAVATSTMAAEEIKELCADHNIELDLVQCRVNEIENLHGRGEPDLHHCARGADLRRHSGGARHAIRLGRRH